VLGGGSDPPTLEPPIVVGAALEDLGPIKHVADGVPPVAELVDAGSSLVAPLIEPITAPLAGLEPPLREAGLPLPALPALPGAGGSPPPAGPGALLDALPSGTNRQPPSGGQAGPGHGTDAGSPGNAAAAPDSLTAATADGPASVSPASKPAETLGSAGPGPLADPRLGHGLARPAQPLGWATPLHALFGTGTTAIASGLLGASPAVADPAGALGADPPQPAAPGGAAAGSGGSGVGSSTLFALLLSLAAVALRHSTRLQLAPARWRPQAFVAVLERPG
jgi:hypothetical protein